MFLMKSNAPYMIKMTPFISVTLRLFNCSLILKDYSKCYKILGIPNNSDQETVRRAFIELCKKYHPDSGKLSADSEKFHEIDSAYKTLQNKFAEERWNVDESIGEYGLYYDKKKNKTEEIKPKHTAPQHRQYLSYDGIGSGTPSQRQKQYVKYKTITAAQNVTNHQIKKITVADENSLLVKDKIQSKKIKTRYGMERLVEDLIQESMAKGHFDNLKGQGKPLSSTSSYNPYVDFVTHKLNEILIENGFAPEWINLNKEITDEINSIKNTLIKERKNLGPYPLNYKEEFKWKEIINNLQTWVKNLNQKINKFNLVVPILTKQKLYFNLEKESDDILKNNNNNNNLSEKDEEFLQKQNRLYVSYTWWWGG
ncbi:J domain-containing protein C21orf55, putative [Pediculus humanus corporis]|uniref:J domain-containing protein C21orf55, putative n=1 Tax=Pediculus humanus subsp. corporis TaxID=121224 RepID=E0VUS1_PEDHC|nr:J domain-containing protein C21orf55, putative [Pediculus humanus corporis]EEB17127.1 J domain-containing protein C21orf55, putative [Pediculus humanus corporis]